jgi:hypothetical protein
MNRRRGADARLRSQVSLVLSLRQGRWPPSCLSRLEAPACVQVCRPCHQTGQLPADGWPAWWRRLVAAPQLLAPLPRSRRRSARSRSPRWLSTARPRTAGWLSATRCTTSPPGACSCVLWGLAHATLLTAAWSHQGAQTPRRWPHLRGRGQGLHRAVRQLPPTGSQVRLCTQPPADLTCLSCCAPH